MKKVIYTTFIMFISLFIWSCEEDSDSDALVGNWGADSYQWDFSISLVDLYGYYGEAGAEIDLTCSSDILQLNEDTCTDWPCDWDENAQTCGPEAETFFSDEGGVISLDLNSDGTLIWAEVWIDPTCAALTNEEQCEEMTGECHWMNGICINMYEDETCASIGAWEISGSSINFTSNDTTGCNVFENITSAPVPYTASGNQMSWTLAPSAIYNYDYYGDYDYGDYYTNNSSIMINWSK